MYIHTYIRGHSQKRGGIVVQSARFDSSRNNLELRSGEAERWLTAIHYEPTPPGFRFAWREHFCRCNNITDFL